MTGFHTARLRARRPRPGDLTGYAALLLHPAVQEWLRPPPLAPFTPADPGDLLERDIAHWEQHGWGPCALVGRGERDDDVVLGRGGLAFTTVAGEFAVELPWTIHPGAQGAGLATEAARGAVAWARDLGLEQVVSFTTPHNAASRRVMERAGLACEGEIEHAGLPHVLYRLRFPAPPTATTPVWQDPPAPVRAPQRGDLRCEACVIGGGIGGIAAAWHLAERGVDVVVLEAATVAGGASGRNGGFFMGGAAPMYHRTRELWGRERARAVHAASLAGQSALLAAAGAAGVRDHIRLIGLMRIGMDAAEAADVAAHHAALVEDGFPGELLEAGDLPRALRRPERRALLTPQDGAMDGAAVVRGLAADLERRGVRIFEGSPVTAPPETAGDGVLVRTAAGSVRAGRAVVALDAQLATLVPAAAAVRSRRLNACATAPAALGLVPRPLYMRDGYEYAQQRPDGRIVCGGFSDLDGAASWTNAATVSAPVQERLDRFLREELGVEAPVTHRWAGLVGYAEDPLPRCGAVPGTGGRVLALGGYNGTGVVQSFVAARIATELACDGASPDAGLYAPPGEGGP